MKPAQHAWTGLSGDALADVADAYLAKGDLRTALQLFNRAEPEVGDPDRCAGGRWMAHMLGGELEAAWRESDAIRQRGRPDPHRFWDGESLRDRRVILRSLHGFGDAVQMFRFLPALRTMAKSLAVEVPPRLLPLAPYFDGMGEVMTWGADAPAEPPVWDAQIEVMEVPYVLRVDVASLEPREGYLHLPVADRLVVQQAMGPGRLPRVGLVWSAGVWNPARSVPFADFRELLNVPGIEFWSLQGEGDRFAWPGRAAESRFRDVYDIGDGILTLACVVGELDLVITVDTLAAHLAGALGKPCWLLLQHQADWRWMTDRADSPWYPSLRLWRQRAGADWVDLMRGVCTELESWSRQAAMVPGKSAGLLA